MRISDITITHHVLPLDPPFRPSWDGRPRTGHPATIVRVSTDEGLTGIGSGDSMLGFAGHEHLFIGQDPLALERHYRVLENLGFLYGRCWPLDIALWDLAGKITGQPVWKLLGGLSDRVRAYASSGALRTAEESADMAERVLERGFRALKLRFGRSARRDDIAAVRAVRDRVGDRLELMVDCNQGWRMPWDTQPAWSLKDALAVARELEALDVYWMEEPLHRGDLAGMAALRTLTGLRIAGGEGGREMHSFAELVSRGCLDVLQPDVSWTGGITGLRRVAVLALEHHLAFSPHTWNVGIGVLANAHLAAGLAGSDYLEFPYDPPDWSLERRDYPMTAPLDVDAEGWIVLRETPGLGFDLDEERLAATRVEAPRRV
jgi:L-alanine-DL-glutamate epimerase-like enolase superfamily enzyme